MVEYFCECKSVFDIPEDGVEVLHNCITAKRPYTIAVICPKCGTMYSVVAHAYFNKQEFSYEVEYHFNKYNPEYDYMLPKYKGL